MKAGHNIHAGLETIAHETFDPVKMEFRKVLEEIALGAPVEPTLHNLGKRVPLIDLKFFITGLILQRQTGANMVQVLENLAAGARTSQSLGEDEIGNRATTFFRRSSVLTCRLSSASGSGFSKPEYIRLLYSG